MSRSAALAVVLAVVLGAAFAGLIWLANTTTPPQTQVEGTVPDDKLPR